MISLILKSMGIASLATIAAWAPVALILMGGVPEYRQLEVATGVLPVAILGNFGVGLPIALLTYWLAGKELARSRQNVLLAANLAGVMLLIVTAALNGMAGVIFYGLPSVIAANVFAFLGWAWILEPLGMYEPSNG